MRQQIKIVLPRSAWDNITITENGEQLVSVEQTDRLKLNLIKKDYTPSFFVRESIKEKIIKISNSLPHGINLVLIEGYRSTASQKYEWDRVYNDLKDSFPNLSDDEINKKVGLLVAKPLPLANHHCGGAIDVTLCSNDGTLFDMGTGYISEIKNMEEKQYIPMFADRLTQEQQSNRTLLREAMEKEGFVWYPGEWWHYCYGDRMWAVYTNKKESFYGPIEKTP